MKNGTLILLNDLLLGLAGGKQRQIGTKSAKIHSELENLASRVRSVKILPEIRISRKT